MNQLINDVAITITQKIYSTLVYEVINLKENQESDNITHSPTYYQVREKIYDVLVKYIKHYRTEFEHGKYDSRLPPSVVDKMIKEAEKVEALEMSKEIMMSGVFKESKHQTPFYTNITKDLLLLDINAIQEDAIGTKESLEIAFSHSK